MIIFGTFQWFYLDDMTSEMEINGMAMICRNYNLIFYVKLAVERILSLVVKESFWVTVKDSF